jgi:hypothetical protein
MSMTRRGIDAQETPKPDTTSAGTGGRRRVFISFNISDAHAGDDPVKWQDFRSAAKNLLVNGYKYGLINNAGTLSNEILDEQAESLVEVLSQDNGIDWVLCVGAEQNSSSPPPQPPPYGERFLYLVLSKEERENLIGDLAEEFAALQARHGRKFAKVWYWKQVCGSLLPLIRRAVRWGLLASAVEWFRRLT